MSQENTLHQSSSTTEDIQQILRIIDYLLGETSEEVNSCVSRESLKELKAQIITNKGTDLDPSQINTIILIILEYVTSNLLKMS